MTTNSGNPKNPFSFEGRVRRTTYWITTYWITNIICNIIFYVLTEATENDLMMEDSNLPIIVYPPLLGIFCCSS